MNERSAVLSDRRRQIYKKDTADRDADIVCDVNSVAGAMSQRGCVYNGARVVLNPITDAVHLVHGAIGCAAYTCDIRGSLSSGPETYRYSFSTDMREKDVIFGGEEKLYQALRGLIEEHRPPAVFAYSTCIVGVIGDDLRAVCKRVEEETGTIVVPVQSEGFKGNKADGYHAACDALLEIIGRSDRGADSPRAINLLGEFNLAGELWVIKNYLAELGIEVVATLTGDARVAEIMQAHTAGLNAVQCAGSMTYLAKKMQKKYGIPFVKVSFFGLDDTEEALIKIAGFFDEPALVKRAWKLCRERRAAVDRELDLYRDVLKGKRAAVYMGGAFKTLSLIKAFRDLGMEVVVAGSQTGKSEDYEEIRAEAMDGAVIIDDAGVLELVELIGEQEVDILVGGVKERPIAYKSGIGFCDFNHERKRFFSGFEGLLNFAREVHATVNSPVWAAYRKITTADRRPAIADKECRFERGDGR
ncbi:MAG: nitrogenase iron-molybdenum cofactor biosynthesis protein NifE [Actinobacteria bacterium]|nr:nitrogenase iron-molybdenum cofactor biosynthesis protein NifE [Actinomycetota bacterium]